MTTARFNIGIDNKYFSTKSKMGNLSGQYTGYLVTSLQTK